VALLTLAASEPRGSAFLKKVGDGIADVHLVPDPDAHGRAFLGVHGLAAQVFLVEPEVQHVAAADPVDQGGLPAEPQPEKVEPGLVQHEHNLAEKHVNLALAFLDNRVDPEHAHEGEKDRLDDEHRDKGDSCSHEIGRHATPPRWHGRLRRKG